MKKAIYLVITNVGTACLVLGLLLYISEPEWDIREEFFEASRYEILFTVGVAIVFNILLFKSSMKIQISSYVCSMLLVYILYDYLYLIHPIMFLFASLAFALIILILDREKTKTRIPKTK